jgi:hypothetical protein
MFGNRRKAPADSPFHHVEGCKTPDAAPSWGWLPGEGRWERVCGCHREFRYVDDGTVDPNSAAAEPAWTAHKHSPSCEASSIPSVVRVERRPDGGWRSTCLACSTLWVYYLDAGRVDANGRPVIQDGPCLYQYPTKHTLTEVPGR